MTITVGIDIGTTSVKAVAVDDDGNVVARARVPHRLIVTAPDRFEHDANEAWFDGPRSALAELGAAASDAAGVAVSAMVPSLAGVDREGRALTPGLLYGDARGIGEQSDPGPGAPGEVLEFLRWTSAAAPGASGYWPAAAVVTNALGGEPVIDIGTAFTSAPLYGGSGWDTDLCASCGVTPDQLPRVEMMGAPVGRLHGDGPVLGAGSVDVLCEQLTSGAGAEGDVHVLCGTTLIVWVAIPEWREQAGLWTIPGMQPNTQSMGGASNAGGLFLNWIGRFLGNSGADDEHVDPANVPIWLPYLRGERTPYHDRDRRAVLHGLDLTHGPAAAQRAAWEAAGFVVRHHIDLVGVPVRRIVATGGGTRVSGWMQALADTTGLPVHVSAVPDGAAQGAAFFARMAAGLERDMTDAARWAATDRIVEPDPRWVGPAVDRYARFLMLSGAPGGA